MSSSKSKSARYLRRYQVKTKKTDRIPEFLYAGILLSPSNYVFEDMQSAMQYVFEIHRAQGEQYSPRSVSSLGWQQLPKGCCCRLLPPTTGLQFPRPSQQVPKDHVHLGWSAIRV